MYPKKLWYLNYSTLFIEESDPQSNVDQINSQPAYKFITVSYY